MSSFTDGPVANKIAMDYRHNESEVDGTQSITIHLTRNGGFPPQFKWKSHHHRRAERQQRKNKCQNLPFGCTENEDKTGIPFVGRAGKLLNEFLTQTNISREKLGFALDKLEKKYGRNADFFKEIVEKIIKETKLPVLGFDHYTQCYDELEDQQKGINYFLEDLSYYSKICNENNVDLFVSLLSVGHWNYRVPNYDDLRWQMNVSLAYGAKGIVWFYFHQKLLDESFRMSPFMGEEFIKSETFNYIQAIQVSFKKNFESIFDSMKFVEVSKYENIKYVDKDEMKISIDRKLLFFLTTFEKDNKKIYMLTNGSQKFSNHFNVIINNIKKDFYLSPGEFKILNYED